MLGGATCRRRGVSRLLMGRCERLARQWGQQELWLHVDRDNAVAAEMYYSLGYEKAGEDPWYSAEKRLLLRKRLAPLVAGRAAA